MQIARKQLHRLGRNFLGRPRRWQKDLLYIRKSVHPDPEPDFSKSGFFPEKSGFRNTGWPYPDQFLKNILLASQTCSWTKKIQIRGCTCRKLGPKVSAANITCMNIKHYSITLILVSYFFFQILALQPTFPEQLDRQTDR